MIRFEMQALRLYQPLISSLFSLPSPTDGLETKALRNYFSPAQMGSLSDSVKRTSPFTYYSFLTTHFLLFHSSLLPSTP